MKRKFLAFVTMLLVCVCQIAAQTTITVNGTVVQSEDQAPIIGASVLVVGTDKGAITDIDGKFQLTDVPEKAELRISYVGMKSQTIQAGKNLVISLGVDAQVMEEVVVTAMGIQRQAKALGYATAKVDADDLTAAKGSDATAALSGKVSGLYINLTSPNLDQETKITLRGARSFKGSNSALLVLDGVITPLDFLQALNPNDIDNISVLKGASAAALYGSEAANGVLIVSTKNGKKGRPSITYSVTATMDTPAYFPKFQTRFGAGQPDSTTGLPLWSGYIEDENQQYGPEFDGRLVNIGSPLNNGTAEGYYLQVPYSYVEDGRTSFFNNGFGIQNDISYSSSDDRGSMYISYQRADQKGIIDGDERVRQTVRFNGSRKYKTFTATARMTYTNTKFDMNNDSAAGVYELINIPGNVNIADYKNWRQPGIGASPDEWINDYYMNPYWNIDNYRREMNNDRFSGSLDFTWQALSWLKLNARGGLNLSYNNSNTKSYAWRYSEWAQENIYQASSGVEMSSFTTSSRMSSRVNLDFMALAEHQINEDFAIKGMLGYSIQDNYYETKSVSASSLSLDDFFNVDNKVGELSGSNSWNRSRKIGLFGSVDLSYKNWAFLQLTGRNDWTSLLDPSKWSFFYPSANASFVLTDAIPALKSEVLNHFKVRASAAKVGTVNIGVYNLDNVANVATDFPFGTLSAYSLSENLRTRDIEPEFTTEYEVGAEFGFFNNRVNLEAAAYIQTTTNQTTNVAITTATGYGSRYINAGTMRGKGLEFDLRLTPLLQFGDFHWNVNANLTLLDTRVKELAGGATEMNLDSDWAGYAIVGARYPMIKATDWVRNPEGKIIVDPVTGLPKAGDIVAVGTSDPTVRIGLNSVMKWKGFSLAATFDYRGGHYTRPSSEYNMLFTGASYISGISGRQRFVFPNSVIEETDASGNVTYRENTDITVNDAGKTFWNGIYKQGRANQIISAASWRLRELSLGYDVPKKYLKKVGFLQRASVSLVGRNLFMWTPSTNIWGDPDFTGSGNGNVGGFSGTNNVGQRSYGFNLLLSF